MTTTDPTTTTTPVRNRKVLTLTVIVDITDDPDIAPHLELLVVEATDDLGLYRVPSGWTPDRDSVRQRTPTADTVVVADLNPGVDQ